MPRRHRALLTVVLSLLLVGMQLQSGVHALEHVGEMLRHGADRSLILPVPDACSTCALFAGGANAIACDSMGIAPEVTRAEAPSCAFASLAADAPYYYLSRAPPSAL
jgi:hypothetical protein